MTMEMTAETFAADSARVEYFDVIIVGAGISGIGSAWHMKRNCPEMTYVILEAKESFGGTWHTHRYPGVRSDSDLFTFGYNFRPWKVSYRDGRPHIVLSRRDHRRKRSCSAHPL